MLKLRFSVEAKLCHEDALNICRASSSRFGRLRSLPTTFQAVEFLNISRGGLKVLPTQVHRAQSTFYYICVHGPLRQGATCCCGKPRFVWPDRQPIGSGLPWANAPSLTNLL